MGAGRALKPGDDRTRLRRLAVRSAAALRAPIGAHNHAARRARGDVRPVCPHEGEGCRPRQQTRRLQRTPLFRLDATRDRRARTFLGHPLGARTVEPAMAPAPIDQEQSNNANIERPWFNWSRPYDLVVAATLVRSRGLAVVPRKKP